MLNNTLLSNTHLSTMIMIFKYVIHIIKSSIFFFSGFSMHLVYANFLLFNFDFSVVGASSTKCFF